MSQQSPVAREPLFPSMDRPVVGVGILKEKKKHSQSFGSRRLFGGTWVLEARLIARVQLMVPDGIEKDASFMQRPIPYVRAFM